MPAPGGRVAALDALRGFALLGILLMNSEYFARPLQGIALGFDRELVGADRAAGLFVATFVQGKFWTLFSLLFGAGFAALAVRAGERFDGVFARRLAVLLGIGLLHAFLLWPGDILVSYALAGVALWLIARAMPPPQLGVLGLAIFVIPLALMWSSLLAVQVLPPLQDAAAVATEYRSAYQAAAKVYAEGSYAQVTVQRIADALMQWSWFASILPNVLGVFLLGTWAWHRGLLRDPSAHRATLARVAWVAFPLGLPIAIGAQALALAHDATVLTPGLALASTLSSLGNLVLCAAYGSTFLWLATRPGSRLAAWLAPAGRMSITNYLAQSLVFTTLFYGYGMGLWGHVGRAGQVALAIAFFALQVAWSRAWFARFRLGPVEWAWRAATWLQRPAMRR